MFQNLRDTIKELNSDVNNVANSKKAKELKNKLLKIGIPLALIGFIGVFVCFTLFATTQNMGAFILFLPCGFVGMIGLTISSLGFKIVVTGYTSNLINETVGNNCPNCKKTINKDMKFCPFCGTKIVKECPKCNHINDYSNNYCEKCGEQL